MQQSSRVDGSGESKGELEGPNLEESGSGSGSGMMTVIEKRTTGESGLQEDEKVTRPDVSLVVQALGEKFRDLLAERSCNW